MSWTLCLVGALAASTPPQAAVRAAPALQVRSESGIPPTNLAPRLVSTLRRRGRARAWVVGDGRGLSSAAARIGRVFAVDVDVATARDLGQRGWHLSSPPHLRLALDDAVEAVGARNPREGSGYTQPYRGAGVLIGAYDTGLDVGHPAFGQRVVATWDQATDARCAEAELSAGRCELTDRIGHGTHVMAVAASSDETFGGVAPDAGLALVRSDDYQRPLEALAWLEEQARLRALPLVVNLSLVTQEGPHDGTSVLSRALAELDAVVVAAAGNDGRTPLHARTQGGIAELDLVFPSGPRAVVADLWSANTFEVTAAARQDGNPVFEARIAPGNMGRSEILRLEGAAVGAVELDASDGPSPRNEAFNVRVQIETSPRAETLEWSLRIESSAPVDAWLEPEPGQSGLPTFSTNPDPSRPQLVLGDTESTVSDPATGAEVLAVSAYVNDLSVGGATGGEVEGRMASFSALGPSLGATPKPDLAAPGAWVVAARPRGVGVAWPVGALSQAARGTSVSAPFVSGAAAVLRGAVPQLTPSQIRDQLRDAAAPPPDEDPRWGRGRLDLEEALAPWVETTSCTHDQTTPSRAGARATIALWLVLFGIVRLRRQRTA